jgi:hypothetical protein
VAENVGDGFSCGASFEKVGVVASLRGDGDEFWVRFEMCSGFAEGVR